MKHLLTEDSDVVTATLCWIDSEPKAEGLSNGVANVRANAIMIKPENGHLILRCNSLISEGMSFPFNVTKDRHFLNAYLVVIIFLYTHTARGSKCRENG